MSSRIIDPDGCDRCDAEDNVRRRGARFLCEDCRDERRRARSGPLD